MKNLEEVLRKIRDLDTEFMQDGTDQWGYALLRETMDAEEVRRLIDEVLPPE